MVISRSHCPCCIVNRRRIHPRWWPHRKRLLQPLPPLPESQLQHGLPVQEEEVKDEDRDLHLDVCAADCRPGPRRQLLMDATQHNGQIGLRSVHVRPGECRVGGGALCIAWKALILLPFSLSMATISASTIRLRVCPAASSKSSATSGNAAASSGKADTVDVRTFVPPVLRLAETPHGSAGNLLEPSKLFPHTSNKK